MLKIQVLGNGMIPRGYGLAPRLEPFPADLTLIKTIMSTHGLTVNMLNPATGKFVNLTPKNVDKMWKSYKDVRSNVMASAQQDKVETPAKVENNEQPAKEESSVNEEASKADNANSKEEPREEKPAPVEEKKPQQNNYQNNNNSKNNQGNNHQNNNKQNNGGGLKPVNAPENK